MVVKQTVTLRQTVLGSGRPKLAVPVTGRTAKAILSQAADAIAAKPDLVEWRIDFFDDVQDALALQRVGAQLRDVLGDVALLTAFRTKQEGGELALPDEDYFQICATVINGNFTDALDLERYHDEGRIEALVTQAHAKQVAIVMSNHDFDQTPTEAELIRRLGDMADLKADVLKVAVMPQSVDDVLTLLAATHHANQALAQPIITMSMGDLGKVTRMAGELVGSVVSFATVGAASAPGQIALTHLKGELDDLKLS